MNTSPQMPEMVTKWIIGLSDSGYSSARIAKATVSREALLDFGFKILKEDLVEAILWILETNYTRRNNV